MKYDVVCMGSCVRDIVFYTSEAEFLKNPKNDPTKVFLLGFEYGAKIKSDEVYYSFGGGAANTAINFANLNLKTAIISAVGDDGLGAEIINRLKQKKVDSKFISVEKKLPTGLSFLVVDKNSNEHVVLVSYGANNGLKKIPHIDTKWLYVSSLSTNKWAHLMDEAIRTKVQIAWNPGATQLKAGYMKLKKYFKYTDVLLLNKDEAIELCLSAGIKLKKWDEKKLAEIIWSWGVGLVSITDGIKGVWVYYANKHYYKKPHHGKPKDTTGAGDCFGSTLIAGLIKTKGDINKSLDLAIKNSSALVFKPGAQEGLLTWQELNK
ncbi:MAG: carbohydrate kinase family protein [Patescibacteria group bacterium]